ncbi:hypothetical protein GPJ55_21675 [Bacillus subtilis]|nr:hypothetical protein GPJ55_21675 [Bacillus subtilis]
MSVKEISIEELKQKLEQEEAIQLVDVRENEEVAEGMIPEAIHIRMGDIPEKLDAFDHSIQKHLLHQTFDQTGSQTYKYPRSYSN